MANPFRGDEPSKKDVVLELMKFEGREEAMSSSHATGCSKPLVRFRAGTGFSNPFRHLRACYARGKPEHVQVDKINGLYRKAKQIALNRGGTIRSHFSIRSLTDYDKTVYGYLRLIVMHSLPITIVEDAEYRRFSHFDVKICYRTMLAVICRLVELVEHRVSEEMKGTVGAVMFDGWSSNATHFVCVLASYCVAMETKASLGMRTVCVPRITLLALSPLGHVTMTQGQFVDDEYTSDEATKFNAETHLAFFEQTFRFYKLDLSKWCTCYIGDNASVNVRILNLSNKPLVGCANHKLNLDVNSMVRSASDLKSTIDSVHSLMKVVKTRIKNAATLRNLTDLRPVIHNETRWSGKYKMLARFGEIKDHLLVACDNDDVEIPSNYEGAFTNKVARYERMLGAINVVQDKLQTKGYKLMDCRSALDLLTEAVEDEKNTRGSPFFGCKFTPLHISPDSSFVKCPHFEKGVIKIQAGRSEDLNNEEREALEQLRRTPVRDQAQSSTSRIRSMAERFEMIRKPNAVPEYFDCDFVLGSVAESKRVWNICNYVLSDHRSSMTPHLFESLIYLRYNEQFWDEQLVAEAISSARRPADRE